MVTRTFASRQGNSQLRQFNQHLGETRSLIGRTILPALGLTAALSIMGGGFNDATAAGRQASSAMYGVQVAMYGIQDAVTRALLPAIEKLTPLLADAANFIVDADKATDGWSTNLGLAAGAAFVFRRQLGATVQAGRTWCAGGGWAVRRSGQCRHWGRGGNHWRNNGGSVRRSRRGRRSGRRRCLWRRELV